MEKMGKCLFFTGSSYGAELSLNTFHWASPDDWFGVLCLATETGIFLPGYVKPSPRGTLYCGLTGARGVKVLSRPAEAECFKPEELYNVRWKKQKCGFESSRKGKIHLLFNMVQLQNAFIST